MDRAIHIIKSPSYNSDGRLQKWVKQLNKYNISSTVFIIEDDNCEAVEENDNVTISKKSLFFRKIFKKRSGYVFKVPEYLFKSVLFIRKSNPKVIIFHDVQQYLNLLWHLLLNSNRSHKVIWDLHELPHDILLTKGIFKPFLKFLLNNVDAVVYTNIERRKYIKINVKGLNERKYFILNNFPDKKYLISSTESVIINSFGNSNPYILWLGAGIETRNFGAFLKAFRHFKDQFNLVVIGKIDPKFDSELSTLRFEKRIFNRFVDQSEIKKYIDNCFLSIVLYNTSSVNNLLCEPNRLYQLVSRNIPVVVGNNPTMANLINKLKVGVVLPDDGVSSNEIIRAIHMVIENNEKYKENSMRNDYSKIFSWENQINEIIDFIIK